MSEEKKTIAMGQRGIEAKNIEDLWRLATIFVQGGCSPAGCDPRNDMIVAKTFNLLQAGKELGLSHTASLRCLYEMGGKITMYGDIGLGLVRASGLLEEFQEDLIGDIGLDPAETPDDVTAICHVKRSGYPREKYTFSVKDAKRAHLWMKKNKSGSLTPWCTHPGRMLKYKARAFGLRDQFGDILLGMHFYEEMIAEEDQAYQDSLPVITEADLEEDAPPEPTESPVSDAEPELTDDTVQPEIDDEEPDWVTG